MKPATLRVPQPSSVALYRPAIDERLKAGIFCAGFGLQRISGRVTNRTLDGFAAVFIAEGDGWLETNAAGRQSIAAPALFWLHPDVAHSYGPHDGSQWLEHWALFDGDLARGFRAAGLLDPLRPVAAIGDGIEVAALFAALHTDFLDDHWLGALAAGATIHRLIARTARPGPELARAVRGDFDAAMKALRERAFEPIDLEALAAEFDFSPATLRRRVHATHGVSPKGLLMQWRCGRAKELLALSEIGIEEIARQTGFEDPHYFSRVFAQREGLPPTEFRRRNQRG
jgi:AraC family transcriptional regulator of arabinose operon